MFAAVLYYLSFAVTFYVVHFVSGDYHVSFVVVYQDLASFLIYFVFYLYNETIDGAKRNKKSTFIQQHFASEGTQSIKSHPDGKKTT